MRAVATLRSLHRIGKGVIVSLCCMMINADIEKTDAALINELRVSTDFPGGSAEIREVDPEAGAIHIQPALRWEQGWPCWWYLRIEGLTRGKKVELTVSANPRPFRRKDVLGWDWSQPDRASISIDNKVWRHTAKCRREKDGRAIYEFEATGEQVWLAWGPPFLLTHAEALLENVENQTNGAERFTLAKTRRGRLVPGIRIGGGTVEQPAKYGVWVQARQHAWEAGSSWVGKGFLEWVAGDNPEAIELRRQATIRFVPIMDVDRVSEGAGGKNSVPRDHNRDWDDTPFYPAVAAAQQKLGELYQTGKLDVYIDLHNPGASDRQPYFFGPFQFEKISAISKRNYNTWLDLAKQTINGPLKLEPKYFVTSYVRDEEELNRMSSNWVRNHTGPKMFAATLETAWNTPHSTQAGYQTVGRQLGETLAKYLLKDPRRELTP
jgi:hypothetical protein